MKSCSSAPNHTSASRRKQSESVGPLERLGRYDDQDSATAATDRCSPPSPFGCPDSAGAGPWPARRTPTFPPRSEYRRPRLLLHRRATRPRSRWRRSRRPHKADTVGSIYSHDCAAAACSWRSADPTRPVFRGRTTCYEPRATPAAHASATTPSRSRTLRTSSNLEARFPGGKRICPKPAMLLNSSQPSSKRTIALANPKRPWKRPTS